MNERRWWLIAAAAGIATASCLVAAASGLGRTDGPPAPPAAQAASLTVPVDAPSATIRRSIPVRLRIPALHLTTSLSSLGTNPDGTVAVPTDYAQPGWFRRGPTPGQIGSAVILGHVDSYRGPAVFFRLGDLRKGDRVAVTLADRMVVHFVVTAVAIYPKARFPAHRVYGSHGYSALQLVTCGGAFDHKTGHYKSNVVVYTRLVGAI